MDVEDLVPCQWVTMIAFKTSKASLQFPKFHLTWMGDGLWDTIPYT